MTTPCVSSCARRARQRGAATLIVVMVLFFLVSLMAAYTSRNMIFEQKTSANQARSTQAFEAAEAGLEWALTMLNGGKVGPDCTTASATNSFRERYLVVNNTSGLITETMLPPSSRAGNLLPTCVYNGSGWTCTCPSATGATPSSTPTGSYTGPQPAFRVRILQYAPPAGPRAGLVRVEATGCTRLDNACLGFANTTTLGDGVATVSTLVALRSGLATTPTAAITAAGAAVPAGTVNVSNLDPASNGITVLLGGTLTSTQRDNYQATSLPGTPSALTVLDGDTSLAEFPTSTVPDRMFGSVFGMRPQQYQQQPGVRICTSPCTAGGSGSNGVVALMAANPDRPIWVDGDLTLDANIGNITTPALLIVNGNVTASASGLSITGLVYLRPTTGTANVSGSATITGALVADNNAALPANLAVTYSAAALAQLRATNGSYVRVPGGWHDYLP